MKRIFITGGTSGLGLALSGHYLAKGDQVAISSLEPFEKIQDVLPSKAHYYQANVINEADMKMAIEDFSNKVGGLDMVIAAAGVNHAKNKFPNLPEIKIVAEINLLGVINTIAPAIEMMKKQGSGHIVGFSSLSGLYGLPGMSVYGASKAAVLNMFETLSIDLPTYGIDVTCLAPGFIATPLTKNNNHKMPFLMSIEDALLEIIWAIDKKKALHLFPRPLAYMAVLLKIIPRSLYRFIMKKDLLGLTKKN